MNYIFDQYSSYICKCHSSNYMYTTLSQKIWQEPTDGSQDRSVLAVHGGAMDHNAIIYLK